MSADDADAAERGDVQTIENQRWYFAELSQSQAELVLGQADGGRFVVSNVPSTSDYRLSVRVNANSSKVDHIAISFNKTENCYTIDGRTEQYPTVISAVRSYADSCEVPIQPYSGSLIEDPAADSRPTLLSIRSIEASFQPELPPAYGAAISYPTDKKPLPQIKTKLDPNKATEATLDEGTVRRIFSARRGDDDQFQYMRDRSCGICCCLCPCEAGVGACEAGEHWYSLHEAGWLRKIFLYLGMVLLILLCGGWVWGCLLCCVSSVSGCLKLSDYLEEAFDDD